MPIRDLHNQIFGRLTVRRLIGVDHNRAAVWECQCVCGIVKPIVSAALTRRLTVSCGCLKIEKAIARTSQKGSNNPGFRHGHSGQETRTYCSWKHMMERCSNPNHIHYSRYGGKGVIVCDRWKTFTNFLADMGERPPDTSLGRFGDIGSYTSGNCAWQTRKEQGQEKKLKRFIKTVAYG